MPYKDKEKQREAQRKWEKENRGAGKLREKLSAAQSSIQSLLDAQERREQLERQLRSLETASGR